MHTKYISSIIIFFISISLISCDEGKMTEKSVSYKSIKEIPITAWQKLAQKKIYFGHQSVGFNIMDGVMDIMKEYPEIKLNIVETADKSDFKNGFFAHSKVGKNVDPKSKIDDFSRYINVGIGKEADVAALKFCYVDITAKTNIANILADYSNSIKDLKKRYPDMTIIHFTGPLTVTKSTWKTWLKKILGKHIWEYDNNIKRNEYNEMLLKKYEGKEPIFDIAEVESTRPDGTRETFNYKGKDYYSLYPGYTHDGGHLNDLGRKVVAEQLLVFLVNQ